MILQGNRGESIVLRARGWTTFGFFVLLVLFLWIPVMPAFSGGNKEYSYNNWSFHFKDHQKINNGRVTVGIGEDPSGKKVTPPSGRRYVSDVVNFKAYVNGKVPSGTTITFETPITITIHYPASLERKTGVPLEKLSIFFWDPGLNQWIGVDSAHSVSNADYKIGAITIDKNGRKATVDVAKWPAGDPCMCWGG